MNQSEADAHKQSIGKALGRLPSGVYILTAKHDGRSIAMLASWVQQASFDPPAISIAIANGRPILAMIRASKRLAVSIVPDTDKSLMKRFARPAKEGEDPFANIATIATPSSVPALADALAWIEGEPIAECAFDADHVLIVARVTNGAILREGNAFSHQRGSGFHY